MPCLPFYGIFTYSFLMSKSVRFCKPIHIVTFRGIFSNESLFGIGTVTT